MSTSILLITPPFTQLNTPYPATAYLKGFLNTKGISSHQADLGIEVTLKLFSKKGLSSVFDLYQEKEETSKNAKRIFSLKEEYINSIEDVTLFLQGKNPTIAHFIASRNFLPEADRFLQIDDTSWAFGKMGIQDKAKHFATMYLEDLSDFIKECIDPHFGFSRYAEKLARSANSFDELYQSLQQPLSFIDEILIETLNLKLQNLNPKLVCISVPFPGNVFAALRCGQFIKKHYPNIKVAFGGGFANTELRDIKDSRVFEFIDFITLDDGEAPIENLLNYIGGKISQQELKRTFLVEHNQIIYINNSSCSDYKQHEVGTPDYNDLLLDQYINAIEVINPMHSLWSDGRWNKLTMAHGCYWGKCTFCDISLDYIKIYEPITANLICDRIEELIQKTGNNGFHFVDEAAPPALMKAVALEIIRRKLVVSWWTNIRFEKSFTRDLCLLLRASGCIGVSGGLEVASDRLLQLIQKGITVEQVAKVNKNLTDAGIMVHAYLMYGFPTQTEQETIDSLEMVRQMFEAGILQSAFWHQFTMTAHSPVGLNPEKFSVKKAKEVAITFANNDVEHIDETGTEHEAFSFGLKKSLHNFMHQTCLDYPLHKWFDFKTPKTTVAPNYISTVLNSIELPNQKATTKIIYLGKTPSLEIITKSKKGNQWEVASLTFETKKETISISVDSEQGKWLHLLLPKLSIENIKQYSLQEVKEDYEKNGLEDFELFWDNKPMNTLHNVGLLHL
ncbi:MAG: radical SAM protein [Chitinophagaceae bacterium]|nr:radical SAM protein [Chitinophagaceae bacterium]